MPDIVDMFDAQASRSATRDAVLQDNGSTTYRQLSVLARQIFSNLRELRQPRALIYLAQSPEAYASMLGVLMAGGYYCPVNLAHPVDRQKQVIQLFDPDVILTNSANIRYVERMLSELADYDPRVVSDASIEGFEDTLRPGRRTVMNIDSLAPTPPVLPSVSSVHELAYVMFTSGSTGQPKGVMIRRHAVSKLVEWAAEVFQPTPGDRWGQFSNIAFDLSVLDIYTALAGGAALVPITSTRDRLMPATVIKRHQLTVWHSVPSVIDLMIQVKQTTPEMLNSLRLMSFCGEPLRPHHLEALFGANPNLTVFNTYGPTEITIFCTYIPLRASNYAEACRTTVAIGHPIPGWGIHLVGEDGASEGEIAISGDYIGAGYWRNPSQTNSAYRTLVVNGESRRAYYTGDWAERHGQHLFFMRRMDRQVKVRGNRVELAEVDFYIREFGVANCFSIIYQGNIYSFLELPAPINEDALRNYLATRLPVYALPSKFVYKASFPRNHNDKIDANGLEQSLSTLSSESLLNSNLKT
jgi:D-alanine--poly(phosphoribitol) ligase subunit 1